MGYPNLNSKLQNYSITMVINHNDVTSGRPITRPSTCLGHLLWLPWQHLYFLTTVQVKAIGQGHSRLPWQPPKGGLNVGRTRSRSLSHDADHCDVTIIISSPHGDITIGPPARDGSPPVVWQWHVIFLTTQGNKV